MSDYIGLSFVVSERVFASRIPIIISLSSLLSVSVSATDVPDYCFGSLHAVRATPAVLAERQKLALSDFSPGQQALILEVVRRAYAPENVKLLRERLAPFDDLDIVEIANSREEIPEDLRRELMAERIYKLKNGPVEVGAITVFARDGRSESIFFSDANIRQISGKTFEAALNTLLSRLSIKDWTELAMISFFHNHPSREGLSVPDRLSQDTVQAQAGPDVEVHFYAIVELKNDGMLIYHRASP